MQVQALARAFLGLMRESAWRRDRMERVAPHQTNTHWLRRSQLSKVRAFRRSVSPRDSHRVVAHRALAPSRDSNGAAVMQRPRRHSHRNGCPPPFPPSRDRRERTNARYHFTSTGPASTTEGFEVWIPEPQPAKRRKPAAPPGLMREVQGCARVLFRPRIPGVSPPRVILELRDQ